VKRKIIEINRELCTGCGNCVTDCAEGALSIVNGKAELVNDVFCDGLGACIAMCPTDALKIVEREAPEFDEAAVEEQMRKPPAAPIGGCPGMQVRFREGPKSEKSPIDNQKIAEQVIPSELNQWPTQLHLVPLVAPFFNHRELVVLSTCSASASPDVNWRFVRGRAIVIACPKLDRTEGYVEKLAQILIGNAIPKIIVVRMEVPCCGGLTRFVREAVASCGRTDLICEEATIGLNGDWIKTETLEV